MNVYPGGLPPNISITEVPDAFEKRATCTVCHESFSVSERALKSAPWDVAAKVNQMREWTLNHKCPPRVVAYDSSPDGKSVGYKCSACGKKWDVSAKVIGSPTRLNLDAYALVHESECKSARTLTLVSPGPRTSGGGADWKAEPYNPASKSGIEGGAELAERLASISLSVWNQMRASGNYDAVALDKAYDRWQADREVAENVSRVAKLAEEQRQKKAKATAVKKSGLIGAAMDGAFTDIFLPRGPKTQPAKTQPVREAPKVREVPLQSRDEGGPRAVRLPSQCKFRRRA